ncbi:nuclear transport factor 2 family protein [Devosia sp. XK-2]|uniref:nuclear transport factor 2 family protein n=1 Tax=Devosia sp. XK-2 TaxID=3126689 RepID=UPI0030CB1201
MPALAPASIPEPIAQYFNRTDPAEAAVLFAPDAAVRDEGQWHRGQAAIALWLRSVQERYHPRYQLQQVDMDKDRILVTFQVSGTFPGSPAVLRQAFTIDSRQRIATLETL